MEHKMPEDENGQLISGITWRCIFYIVLVLSPPLAMVLTGGMDGRDLIYSIGKALALAGFAMLMLQPVISARFKWIERPFGLDRLLRIHRSAGVAAWIIVALHPLMLALGSNNSRLLLSLDLPLPLLIAKGTLLILILFALGALLHKTIGIPFQSWFRMHNAGTLIILAGVFAHSYAISIRYQPLPMRFLWLAFLVTGIFSYLHLSVYQRLGSRLNPYIVNQISRQTHDVWNLVLVPPKGTDLFDYLPGQFLFVTLLRDRGLPKEEHPFTISSSPTSKGHITITPKESGDFTATIGKTRPGDRAAVTAPYGRFSHLLHPEKRLMVFIAGGIGITPFMSMLTFMRDTGAEEEVLLIYANRTEKDIVFEEELRSLQQSDSAPNLNIIHVLSKPDPSWKGERGYVDMDKLSRLTGDISRKAFYICGPPMMMKSVVSALGEMGASKDEIHLERFSL